MRNTLKYPNLVLNCGWMLAAGVLLAGGARADIRYSQETRMNEEQSAAAPTSVMVRSATAEAERTDVRSTYGKMEVNQSTIRLCAKNQEIQFDPDLKIYIIKPLNEAAKPAAAKPEARSKKEKKTGKIVTNYIVKDLGEEMIAQYKTRHYMVTTELIFSGCVGENTMESKVEIWVSEIQDVNPCTPTADPAAGYALMAQGDCKLSFEQKGDVAAYTKAYSGIVLRQKVYMDDKVLMTQQITSLSQAKLSEDLFKVPAGYKQVTPEQFQIEQSAALMKAMMTGEAPIGN